MCQLVSTWVIFCQLVSTCVNLCQLVSTCVNLGQLGSFGVDLGQLMSTCVNLYQLGSTWIIFGQLGSTWFNLCQLGSTWVWSGLGLVYLGLSCCGSLHYIEEFRTLSQTATTPRAPGIANNVILSYTNSANQQELLQIYGSHQDVGNHKLWTVKKIHCDNICISVSQIYRQAE